jgi:hypothetical protein
LNARWTRVPAEWTDAVAAASCALGGGDAAALERVLRVVADRAKGPEELKEALPLLTEMAVDAESLGSLMDVAVALSRDMPAERRRDWWGGAPETARLLAAGRPAEARALLTALAERAARWNGAGRWLLTRAAPTLAARLKGPAEFLDAMDALAEDAALWAEDPRAAGVALTCVTAAGTAAGVRRRLAVLRPALAGAERPAVVDGLSAVWTAGGADARPVGRRGRPRVGAAGRPGGAGVGSGSAICGRRTSTPRTTGARCWRSSSSAACAPPTPCAI